MPMTSFTIDHELAAACVDLCYRRYHGDKLWIPPFRHQLEWYYDPRFPFYREPDNHYRHFAVVSGGRVLGHLTALVNGELRRRNDANTALLGLFESTGDDSMVAELLDAAISWLKSEHGVARVWAPINFDIWHENRFRTSGFDTDPFFGEPFNPPEYAAQFRHAAFAVRQTWQSVEVNGVERLKAIMAPHAAAVAAVRQAGYQFVTVDRTRTQDVVDMHAVQMRSMEHACAYTPLPLDEYRRLFQAYNRLLDTRFVTLLRAPDGHVAGLAMAYPDPTAAIRAMRGEANLAARVRFMLHAGRAHRVVFYFVGSMPTDRLRQSGLGRALVCETLRRVLAHGYQTVLFALLAADSGARPFLGDALRGAQRSYALFERIV